MDETGRDALSRLPLFEPRNLRRNTDPSTSDEAAHTVEALRGRHWGIILQVLREHGYCGGFGTPPGLTSQEIADRCELEHWAVTRRMGELRDGGRVIQTNEKRENRSGRRAVVWSLVE